jgi:methylmalonyl-CoA mutase
MLDELAGKETLTLSEDFPPVPTAEWEAAIRKDLKGADYEKKLVWHTDEGIAVRPYYRSDALAGLEGRAGSAPGNLPFARGNGAARAVDRNAAPAQGAVRADLVHESGAHAVQELAIALAVGVERLAETSAGWTVDEAARDIRFIFAVGSTYFFEIAKLRAARLLWAHAVAAFRPADPDSCRMHLDVRTSRLNKSVCDPYTNLLRVTTEAMSAAIGGCDALTVEPFGFDAHLAVNLPHILAEEAHLNAVADPAGGSYYLEALTAALAREAWKLFQKIESEGGYTQALASGWLATQISRTRTAREKAVSSRRRTLVGVNNYPDLSEHDLQSPPAFDTAAAPFPVFRLAEPFERIRERTERHARLTGRVPLLLLLKRGDLNMRMARAQFALNFFGCAGFEIVESEEYAGIQADLIVLCSSDPEYLPFAQDVCPRAAVPVIVAGNPKGQVDALFAAGVKGFVHVMSDAVETLTLWQNRFGMND